MRILTASFEPTQTKTRLFGGSLQLPGKLNQQNTITHLYETKESKLSETPDVTEVAVAPGRPDRP